MRSTDYILDHLKRTDITTQKDSSPISEVVGRGLDYLEVTRLIFARLQAILYPRLRCLVHIIMFSLPTVGNVLSFGFAPFLSFNAIEVVGGGLVALEVSTDLLVVGVRLMLAPTPLEISSGQI